MNQVVAIFSLSGFAAGVLISSFVSFGWVGAELFVFLGIILLLVSLIAESRRLMAFIAVFLFAVGLGMARYELKDARDFSLDKNIGSRVVLQGVISDEPDERENYTRLILETDGNKILVYTQHYPEFKYGDEIKINGVLKKPSNFNEDFDWESYLAKDEIYYEMFYPQTELISSNNGLFIKRWMFVVKDKFIGALNTVMPEPNSSFMAGVTIGARKSMPKDLLDDFKKTGVIHVVVLSGYNITLVADFIMRAFSFLPQALGISLGALGIILFTIMAGAGAATVRASIMALLVILARATGRIYAITWALFLTGFFMILQNPKILRFDAGFQLSFLATLALIWLAPYFDKKFNFITNKWKIREILSATVATQIFVLPLLLYKTGIFSVVALPVNLLILAFMPITMFLGFVTAGAGMIWGALAIPFGWLSYAITQYELFVVKIFANLPFASFNIKNFPLFLVMIIYVVYAIIIYKINERKDKK
jgi:competence protein ComEC